MGVFMDDENDNKTLVLLLKPATYMAFGFEIYTVPNSHHSSNFQSQTQMTFHICGT